MATGLRVSFPGEDDDQTRNYLLKLDSYYPRRYLIFDNDKKLYDALLTQLMSGVQLTNEQVQQFNYLVQLFDERIKEFDERFPDDCQDY